MGCGVGCGVAGFRGGLWGGYGWAAGWVVGWISMGLGGWLAVGVIFGGLRWFWVWVFYIDLFYVAPNTQCRIFSGAFPRVQTNTRKTNVFL